MSSLLVRKNVCPIPCDPSRRALTRILALAVLIGFVGSAAGAVAQDGYELVYRKPSQEPFTSDEVKQTRSVLEQRLSDLPRVSLGKDGSLHVALPEAIDEQTALALRPHIERLGRLSFESVARSSTPGFDAKAGHDRLRAWWSSQEEPSLAAFHEIPHGAGGPVPSVRWRELRQKGVDLLEGELPLVLPCERMQVVHPDRDWVFTGSDLERVYPSSDGLGLPAIGFEMKESRRRAFGEFTEAYVDSQIAIVIDGVVLSAPVVSAPVREASLIQGRFTQEEVDQLIGALRSGPLPVALEFVELRRIEPK